MSAQSAKYVSAADDDTYFYAHVGDFFNLCGIFGDSFFVNAILLFAHERFTAQFQENPFVSVIHNQIRSFN